MSRGRDEDAEIAPALKPKKVAGEGGPLEEMKHGEEQMGNFATYRRNPPVSQTAKALQQRS